MSKNKELTYPNIKDGFLLILGLLFFSLISGLLFGSLLGQSHPLSMPLMYGTPILIVIFLVASRSGFTANQILRPQKSINLISILLIIVVVLCGILILDPIVNLIPMPDFVREMFEKMLQRNIGNFIAIVILAPVLEEILCRGILLKNYIKIYDARKAIIWSAIIFGVMHLNPWQFIGASTLGLFIGWVYYRTQNVWICIFIHFLNNGLAFAAFYFLDIEMESIYDFSPNFLTSALAFILAGVTVYLAIKTLNKQLPSPKLDEENDAEETTAQPED